MSHFTTVVLVNKGEENIQSKVEELLRPFDENLECDPRIYETKEEVIAKFEESRKEIINNPDSYLGQIQNGTSDRSEQKDILSMTLEQFNEWYYGEEQPFDEEGNMLTTSNPNAQWDWWDFGGRWNGKIQGEYKGDNDGGFNFGEEFRQLKDNVINVSDLLNQEKPFIPFAILTPDGEWIERGKMGWWGCVSDEKDKDTWNNSVMTVYEKYKDCVAVACDLHI